MNEFMIIALGLLLMYYLDAKYILIILIFFFILKDYDIIKDKIINITKKEKISDKSPTTYYNSKTEYILNKLKKYSKKHKIQYNKGIFYWTKFVKTLRILEDSNLKNPNQYFDRAFDYLKESVNNFNSISTSVKERELIHGLKFNDFTPGKRTKEVSSLSKKLYKEGYLLLYNLSLELNKRYFKNPNIYTKEIVLDHPLEYDDKINTFDLFI